MDNRETFLKIIGHNSVEVMTTIFKTMSPIEIMNKI